MALYLLRAISGRPSRRDVEVITNEAVYRSGQKTPDRIIGVDCDSKIGLALDYLMPSDDSNRYGGGVRAVASRAISGLYN